MTAPPIEALTTEPRYIAFFHWLRSSKPAVFAIESTIAMANRKAPNPLASALIVATARKKTVAKSAGWPLSVLREIIQRARTASAPVSLTANTRTKIAMSCQTMGLPKDDETISSPDE